jgi:hypothetical protein
MNVSESDGAKAGRSSRDDMLVNSQETLSRRRHLWVSSASHAALRATTLPTFAEPGGRRYLLAHTYNESFYPSGRLTRMANR